ncbi:hypothetical protein JW926_16645 [Candidatus Sumerlaeota bacterium]|nr:hypothetical protein [Candidatus Sumerlaeota bacterium]
MKKVCYVWIFLIFVASAPAFAKSPSPHIYYIKLGEFATENEANVFISSIEQINLSPLVLVHEKELWEARYGEFLFYMDARLSLDDLKESGITNPRIEKKENSRGKIECAKTKGPKSKVFNVAEGEGSLTPCILNMKDPEIEQINNLIKDGATDQIREAVINKIQTCSSDDPKKGWLTMRLAYLKCREKDKETAQQIFQEIAEGKVKASPEARIEAMLRASNIIYSKKERIKAYRAFKEIYQMAEDPQQKAESLLQISGLMMELARSAKGTLEEARIFMENALEEVPESNVRIRATIKQMHMEAWYYEDNYSNCITEGEAMLETQQDMPLKIIATCRIFLGLAYANKNDSDYDAAARNLKEVLALPLGPNDNWKAIPDLKKHSLVWLITLSERFGRNQEAEEWKKTMKKMYP